MDLRCPGRDAPAPWWPIHSDSVSLAGSGVLSGLGRLLGLGLGGLDLVRLIGVRLIGVGLSLGGSVLGFERSVVVLDLSVVRADVAALTLGLAGVRDRTGLGHC